MPTSTSIKGDPHSSPDALIHAHNCSAARKLPPRAGLCSLSTSSSLAIMPVRARMQAKQANVACRYPTCSMLNDTDTCQAPRPSRSSLLRLLLLLRRRPTARPWTSRRCRTSSLISLLRSLFPRRRLRKHQVTCLRSLQTCSRQESSQGHWQLHQHPWHHQASSKHQSKLCGGFKTRRLLTHMS